MYRVSQISVSFCHGLLPLSHDFLSVLRACSVLTIFGYGAPPSDAAAIEMMSKAFSSTFRRLDWIEIIDIKDEKTLINDWADFLSPTNFHVDCYKNFFDSLVARFPRRSIEGYKAVKHNLWFGESGLKLKSFDSRFDLADWLQPLLDNENKGDNSIIRKY